jgi:hypothetical protein
MKIKILLVILIIAAITIAFLSGDKSNGVKSGVLQKVSHKSLPSRNVAELAFDGGQREGAGTAEGYTNTQTFTIPDSLVDRANQLIDQRVIVEYRDRRFAIGDTKILLSIRPSQRK